MCSYQRVAQVSVPLRVVGGGCAIMWFHAHICVADPLSPTTLWVCWQIKNFCCRVLSGAIPFDCTHTSVLQKAGVRGRSLHLRRLRMFLSSSAPVYMYMCGRSKQSSAVTAPVTATVRTCVLTVSVCCTLLSLPWARTRCRLLVRCCVCVCAYMHMCLEKGRS